MVIPISNDPTEILHAKKREKQIDYAEGLRLLADWIETADCDLSTLGDGQTINLFAWNKETFDELASNLGGTREKTLEGNYAIVRRRFGPHTVEVNIARDKVCERVQVGVVTVAAREAVPEHEEPQYEWVCEGFTVTK